LSELALFGKIINHIQNSIYGGIKGISATVNDFNNVKMVVLTLFLFNSSVWPLQKMDGWILENDDDYCKLNQVATPTVAAVPNVIFFLKKMNVSPGAWYATTDWKILFSLYLFTRTTRRNFLSVGKVSSILSVF
jgi:hypothetical protein